MYEITPDLKQIVRPESLGGTPANRMIHKESGQLFIGPYAIDSLGNVRSIPYNIMPGRHTGNARHLTDPSGKIYYGTMEEGLYEVDVHTLAVREIYEDANFTKREKAVKSMVLLEQCFREYTVKDCIQDKGYWFLRIMERVPTKLFLSLI